MEMLRRATFKAVSTIGIPSLLALLLGVPSMTVFIYNIWNALTQSQKSIVVAMLVLIAVAIGIFIYGQVKRELMVIPKIMYKMNERAKVLTNKIEMNPDSEEFKQFMTLAGMSGSKTFEKINDYDTFKERMPAILKEAKARGEIIKSDTKQSMRILRFIHEGHIRKVLEDDTVYQRLKNYLQSKAPIIPTPELSQNIITYNKSTIIRCSFALLTRTDNPQIKDLIPITYQLDAKMEIDNLDEKLMVMLANVNQSIDRYYNGSIYKEESTKHSKDYR